MFARPGTEGSVVVNSQGHVFFTYADSCNRIQSVVGIDTDAEEIIYHYQSPIIGATTDPTYNRLWYYGGALGFCLIDDDEADETQWQWVLLGNS